MAHLTVASSHSGSFNCIPALLDPALDESDRLRKEGKELMEAGHPELAIERYTSVLERHPSDLRARNNRAQVTTPFEAALRMSLRVSCHAQPAQIT